MMKKAIYLSIVLLISLSACSGQRPSGPEAQEKIHLLNQLSAAHPRGNPVGLYKMLSADFIQTFEAEIHKAKTYDSLQVRALPTMEMLRVLSLKNSFVNTVRRKETMNIILDWIESAGKGFPYQKSGRYYYADNEKIEAKLLKEGMVSPQVLMVQEGESIKVDLFNTVAYQEARLQQILKKKSLDDLIKEAAWLYYQTQRRITWGPIE